MAQKRTKIIFFQFLSWKNGEHSGGSDFRVNIVLKSHNFIQYVPYESRIWTMFSDPSSDGRTHCTCSLFIGCDAHNVVIFFLISNSIRHTTARMLQLWMENNCSNLDKFWISSVFLIFVCTLHSREDDKYFVFVWAIRRTKYWKHTDCHNRDESLLLMNGGFAAVNGKTATVLHSMKLLQNKRCKY